MMQSPILVDFDTNTQNATGLSVLFPWTDYPTKFEHLVLIVVNEDDLSIGKSIDLILQGSSRGLKANSRFTFRATATRGEEVSIPVDLRGLTECDYIRAYVETDGSTVPFRWQLRGKNR